jgi:GNAT superfamily N-acetyltransferase
MSEVELAVRKPHAGDVDFLTNSWLESFRDGYFPSSVPNRVYYNQHHRILEKLMPRAQILIACNAKDPEQIFGWVCAEQMDQHLVIHYIYVKDTFRRFGIAKRLVKLLMRDLPVNQQRVLITHLTHKAKQLIKGWKEWKLEPAQKRYGIEFLYNPYMLFWNLPTDWEK